MDFSVTIQDDGTWICPDHLRVTVAAFFNALKAGTPEMTHHPEGACEANELVAPKILVVGLRRISLIKTLRTFYGMGLKEAKFKQEEHTPIKLGLLPYYKAMQFKKMAEEESGATIEVPSVLDRLAKL